MWPNGLSSQAAYAVERGTLSDRGSTQPGRVRLPKNYFNNSYAHDEQGDNPRQEKKRVQRSPL